MTQPTFAQYRTPSTTAAGLVSESEQERLLTLLSVLASGQNPDGTGYSVPSSTSVQIAGDINGTVTAPFVRPNSATGEFVLATSTAQIAWINAHGLPGYPTLPSATASGPLSAMVGDNTTNDQPALKALVIYLGLFYVATGVPATIYCPTGSYSLRDNGTVWSSGVGVIGDGPNRTVFNLSNPINTTNPTPFASFTVAGQGASTSNYLADCWFEGFTIDGSGVALASYNVGAKGFSLQYMVRPTFKDLIIQNCGASGLGCDFLVDAVVENVRAYNNGRLNNGAQAGGAGFGIGTGGWYQSTTFFEGGSFIGCVGRGNGTHGLFFELQNAAYSLPKGFRVVGGRYEGNQFGISDWGCEGLKITGVDLLANLQHGFNVSGASTIVAQAGYGGVVSGCVIDGNGLDGAAIGDSQRYKVVGNRVSNNGRHGVHYTNIAGAQSVGNAAMTAMTNDIYSNGRSGVYVDATLNNPFWLDNVSRNNGISSGAGNTNSGGTVTYTALTVVDSSAPWTAATLVGRTVTVGALSAIIKSNTTTTLTLWPTFANGTTAWGTGGTPGAGTSYTVAAVAADRAGYTINGTVAHPNIRGNRGWDDNGVRIQPYGLVITASGACTSGQVTDNDFLGNLTGSYLFTTAPSGGTWVNNAGLAAGALSSPTSSLTDGPAQFNGTITASGTNLSSGAAVSSPTLGAAAQLAQTTQDAMIYIDITGAATGFQIAIGPTVGVANVLTTGAAPSLGAMFTVRLPAGWYIAVTSTTGTWTAKAITA